MGRPLKLGCDYFSHDADMRNHRKIKAIRVKFGITGYAIWCMLLEHLTTQENNLLKITDTEIELISGDFGVSATEIREVIDYCIYLNILLKKDGFLYSEGLQDRLKAVYDKRATSKVNSSKQPRENGKFTNTNTELTVVSVTEIPQSKVKKSKVKESINTFPKSEDFNGLPEIKIESVKQLLSIMQKITVSDKDVMGMWEVFKIQNLTGKKFYATHEDVYSHFINWVKDKRFSSDGSTAPKKLVI